MFSFVLAGTCCSLSKLIIFPQLLASIDNFNLISVYFNGASVFCNFIKCLNHDIIFIYFCDHYRWNHLFLFLASDACGSCSSSYGSWNLLLLFISYSVSSFDEYFWRRVLYVSDIALQLIHFRPVIWLAHFLQGFVIFFLLLLRLFLLFLVLLLLSQV